MATGSEQLFKREATQKRELQLSPLSKYSEFGVNSMKKTGGRRRMLSSASRASWMTKRLAPSQAPVLGEKPVYNYGHWPADFFVRPFPYLIPYLLLILSMLIPQQYLCGF